MKAGGGGAPNVKKDGTRDSKIESILNTLNQTPSTAFKAKLKLKISGTPSSSSNDKNKNTMNDSPAESKCESGPELGDEAVHTQSLNLPLPMNPSYKLLDILEEFKLTDKEASRMPATIPVEYEVSKEFPDNLPAKMLELVDGE